MLDRTVGRYPVICGAVRLKMKTRGWSKYRNENSEPSSLISNPNNEGYTLKRSIQLKAQAPAEEIPIVLLHHPIIASGRWSYHCV